MMTLIQLQEFLENSNCATVLTKTKNILRMTRNKQMIIKMQASLTLFYCKHFLHVFHIV